MHDGDMGHNQGLINQQNQLAHNVNGVDKNMEHMIINQGLK